MHPDHYVLQPATLRWDSAAPFSIEYNDVYYSRNGGLDESRHVFLRGNQLPARWQQQRVFTIAETGFGTGLNFLVTAQAWLAEARPGGTLHYLSCEKHPLSHADLARSLDHWPELAELGADLLAQYPAALTGFHSRWLYQQRIRLTLLLGDATTMLQQLSGPVDAWYLDGFAPARNPALWQPALLAEVARHSRPGTTLATYSAAGQLRRELAQRGFQVRKLPGFGAKREMVSAEFIAHPAPAAHPAPWFARPDPATERRALIIGAGIAGLSTALRLAQQHWQVTLLDGADDLARGASGNLAGIVMPQLSSDFNHEAQWSLAAFSMAVNWLNTLQADGMQGIWQPSGVLQLLDAIHCDRISALAMPEAIVRRLDADQASAVCGVTLQQGGLLFPQAGWIDPVALCHHLHRMMQTSVELRLNSMVTALSHDGAVWTARDAAGAALASSPVVIIASGVDARRLLPQLALPLQAVRGQLAYIPATPDSSSLRLPVCYDGYMIPALRGQHCVGATFDRDDTTTTLRDEDQQHLLSSLQQQLPSLLTAVRPTLSGRVSFRATSPDHLPLIGPVPDPDYYQRHYADLQRGYPASHYPEACYLPGLFVNTGHGARGFSQAWLAAEILASDLQGCTQPISSTLRHKIQPGRFMIRALRRRAGP